MQRPRAAWLICLGLIAVGGGLAAQTSSLAQQSVSVPVATVLIDTRVAAPSEAVLTLSAASIVLAPGQTSLPVVNTGVWLLVVESGMIYLISDLPLTDRTPEEDGSPMKYRLSTNQRVSVPSGAHLRLIGAGTEPARLFVLSLFPARNAATSP
jgi:hypothetical protein